MKIAFKHGACSIKETEARKKTTSAKSFHRHPVYKKIIFNLSFTVTKGKCANSRTFKNI